jgi:hypothetical protein
MIEPRVDGGVLLDPFIDAMPTKPHRTLDA